MKLQGRELQLDLQGDDVKLLHRELRQLDFTISADEIKKGQFGNSTQKAVAEFQKSAGLAATGIVDEATAKYINARVDALQPRPFAVTGHIYLADKSPLNEVIVSAFDRDLRAEELVGQTTTNADGSYRIEYAAGQFLNREKENADLFIRVLAANGDTLATSPVVFNAPLFVVIDLTVPAATLAPLTLFEKIARSLPPLLADLKIEELEENREYQDLTFLAGETGFEKTDLTRFVLAYSLSQQAVQAEFWFVLLGGSYIQLTPDKSIKEQLTAILGALPALAPATIQKALDRGFGRQEIPETLRARAGEWLAQFTDFVATWTVSEAAGPTFISSALLDAGITEVKKQQIFARLFNEQKLLTPDLLKTLEEKHSFEKNEIADLATSFRLADLTGADFTLIKSLKDGFDIRQPEKIRNLAKKSEDEWVKLLTEKVKAGDVTVPAPTDDIPEPLKGVGVELYATTLARRMRDNFPTAAFSGELERAINKGAVPGLPYAEALNRVFESYANFELGHTLVDDFLQNDLKPDFQDLAGDENFRLELKAVQRVFKLNPTFEATNTLLTDGLHSAQQVYRMGETEFVQRYQAQAGFSTESARIAWNRAADTHAAALSIFGDLASLKEELLAVLRNNNAALPGFPNWSNLFKTGDLCECEHCNSVLSPSAYFADLLLFLRDRQGIKPRRGPAPTVKDILFGRRPDLGYLELNCDNGLTQLPYVDVVCEVLEAAIAGDTNDLELTNFSTMNVDPVDAKIEVLKLFLINGINLGVDYSLSQVIPGNRDLWIAYGEDITYLLKKKAGSNYFFAQILPNTKAKETELRAYPQYVNPKAYEQLRSASYPLKLPFDLFAAEVRATFQKIKVERWELMEKLVGQASPNNATQSELAAEYFGISVAKTPALDEKSLILKPAPTDAAQQVCWGVSGLDWLTQVGNIKNFLQKSGLEYNELLALLDLKFINPKGNISIDFGNSPACDTDKQSLTGLDADSLDRLHRFLRLRQKLAGWAMWEIDLAIRHPALGNGSLDEAFLTNLFYFSRVRHKFGNKTTVEQLLGLFGDLNTETRFVGPDEKRAEGLYQQLFLNKTFGQALDPDFAVGSVNTAGPINRKIADHQLTILAALNIREADLQIFKGMNRASDGAPYLTDDLILTNLSFLWRHSWLARELKFSIADWQTWLKILNEDIPQFASPKAAFEFLRKIDQFNATGFTPDELNWLFTADRQAKVAVKETDAARFLAALRRDLQTLGAQYNPAQYAFLTTHTTSDEENLTGLLQNLLQSFNWSDAAVRNIVRILRGSVVLEAGMPDLPAGFIFPAAITDAPAYIPIVYDEQGKRLRFNGLMTAAQRATLLTDATLAVVTGNAGYQAAVEELYRQVSTAPASFVTTEVKIDLPGGIAIPAQYPSLPLRYDAPTQTLSFTGVMTAAEQAALKATPGNPGNAIDELFERPRLLVKFFEPIFTAPLETLPPAINFKEQVGANLAAKISYDTEQELLSFNGFMSAGEQALLAALVPDNQPAETAYHAALDSLASQPQSIVAPDERVWLNGSDLDATQPASRTFANRLAIAITNTLAYLAKKQATSLVIQQCSAQLGLTGEMTTRLLSHYYVLPGQQTLLSNLLGSFTASSGAVNYPSLKSTFDGWYWANRVAAIWKKWKFTLSDLAKLNGLTANARLLDFGTLPLDHLGGAASLDRFLRTNRLLQLRNDLPETGITLLEVLRKINGGIYFAEAEMPGLPAGFVFPAVITAAPNNISIKYDAANQKLLFTGLMSVAQQNILKDPAILPAVAGLAAYQLAIDELFNSLVKAFAADVEALNEKWAAADFEIFVRSLDLNYPADYLLAETWDRLARAFYFLSNLNAGAATALQFAAATMSEVEVKTLKELLRSRFGVETWLSLSTEIQDNLRKQKRDALAAYLLSQPRPADAPNSKWETTNDLYAYYLLDVEMGACQLTSRLVQASGSVQLFVQRCFMGLEPRVNVNSDQDSAWNWWKWMSKYRVWEANRKVFLWPENWIEPELKQDRSEFFKDLENYLQQNDATQTVAQAAFSNYLEKVDAVAHLEIAGFYQEDDGYDTILHVFGRTPGTEPHIYYYRRYDYRQWTAWEKIETDIEGNYLVPAMLNKRLFLFWPVFTEVPDDMGNTSVKVPTPGQANFVPDKTQKKLRMQMAVSEYRQGRWTSRKISKSYVESQAFEGEIDNKYYTFFALDHEDSNSLSLKYQGYAIDSVEARLASHRLGQAGSSYWKAGLYGTIEISGYRNDPELTFTDWDSIYLIQGIRPEEDSTGINSLSLKWVEREARYDSFQAKTLQDDFTIFNPFANGARYTPVLMKTAGIFKASPGWQLSYMDKLKDTTGLSDVYTGTWLPFFYNDRLRTFLVLPSSDNPFFGESFNYYPQIKSSLLSYESGFNANPTGWVDGFVTSLTAAQRADLEYWFINLRYKPAGYQPPYSDADFKYLINLYRVQFLHYYMAGLSDNSSEYEKFRFRNFYHPFTWEFGKLVNNPQYGIPALMDRKTQLKVSAFIFSNEYGPTQAVVAGNTNPPDTQPEFYPQEEVDFSPDGSYSAYNWELFFHAPLFIANSLSKNQRFEEARDWYHFIFNPVGSQSGLPGGSPTSKYWITRPFFKTTDTRYVQQRIENIMRILSGDINAPGYSNDFRAAMDQSVYEWRNHPFEPHQIAAFRSVAYQKTVVMKYLDNLIAWGDNLFRQDSMESINEATQLYILAAEILGPRPKTVPSPTKPLPETFNELENRQIDAFSNALAEVENLIPALPGRNSGGPNQAPLPTLYFCIPQNDKLLAYWDTVADRLYKIRNCMNIDGVVRQLALFQPPIDPGALVKAVAGGLDVTAALTDLNAPLPLFRFNVLLQKANEVCNDVRGLGGALLVALEKKDAGEIELLRQNQEIRLLEAVKALRQQQIDEAKENLEGLKKTKEVIQARKDFYASIEKITAGESLSLDKQEEAFGYQSQAQVINIGASILGFLPNVTIGVSGLGGSPHVTAQWGNGNIISALQAAAASKMALSNAASFEASKATTLAAYDRRFTDWKLQETLAGKELLQIDRQIAAAELRQAIAEKELENHLLQIENAKATAEFFQTRYTSQELYQWQIGQISTIFFQSYRLAYDLAKRAERCFRFELGLQDSSYISFGYWDSLKKGLLSGEKLQYDLRRLESAYLEQNRREFELTKHVSLALLDPLALVKLRETGRCFINLPEEIFDLDYPGHYFRRLKSVSLTLPCVVGPYTTISCTLRLLKNSIRINTTNGDNGYPRNKDGTGLPGDDGRFIENNIPVKAIAASNAVNDSGVFELNFRDERYLPFEGAGVISQWSLELFNDIPSNNPDFGKPLRQFDYDSISDIILHLKYTTREDSGSFKNAAVTYLREYFDEVIPSHNIRMFNLRQEFPAQWQRFLYPTDPTGSNVFVLEMAGRLFPFRDQDKNLKVNKLWLLARCTDGGNYSITLNPPLPSPPPNGSDTLTLVPLTQYGNLHFSEKDLSGFDIVLPPGGAVPPKWQLTMSRPGGGNLRKDSKKMIMEVEDILLVLEYGYKSE